MRRKIFLIMTSVLALLCTVAISHATNYYVARNGSDVNGDGSQARPWFTVTHADRSGKLRPGDTVHVAPGNYTGPWRTWNTSGTAAAPIAYVSTTKWGAVLHSTTSASVWSNKANYIEIVNFVVVGNGLSKNGIYTSGANTVIRGNEVHGVLEGPYNSTTCNTIGGAGIQLDGPGSLVIGNYVHNNGPHDSSGNPVYCNYVHGIYFERPGGLAANNMSFDNSGWGIQMWHSASNEVVNNNTIFNNGVGCIVVGASDNGTVNDHTVVDNNICYKTNRGIGERGMYGPGKYATGPHNIYHHNLLYDNSAYAFSLQTGTQSGTVWADPRFVNYTGTSSGNCHLSSVSPAIDKGLSSDTIPQGSTVFFAPYDFFGVKRPLGCCFDLGAIEYVP